MEITMPVGPVWDAAKAEKNWLVFAVFEGKNGKKAKKPVKLNNIGMPVGVQEAAKWTFDEVDEVVRHWRDAKKRDFSRINVEREKYAKSKGYGHVDIVDVAYGYLCREGSGLVAIDIDDCIDGDDLRDDCAVFDDLLMFDGYAERSTSGTGLRVMMPRAEDDAERSSGAEAGGCGFFAKGEKGVVLTFDRFEGFGGELVRDDDFIAAVVEARDGALAEGRRGRVDVDGSGGDLAESVLEHGFMSIERFKELCDSIPNEGIDRIEWVGLMLAAKEHFSIQGLEEEAWEVFDAWTSKREDGEYDSEANRKDWERGGRGGDGVATMGSWVYKAKTAGWNTGDTSVEIDGLVPRDELKWRVGSEADIVARWVLVEGRSFDRLRGRFVDRNEMLRETMNVTLRNVSDEGKVALVGRSMEQRGYWFNENMVKFDGEVFLPQKSEFVEDVTLVEGRLVRSAGVRMLNSWGGVREPVGEVGSAQMWVDHVGQAFPDDADWIMDWLAWNIQKPGKKINHALVMVSREGIGKDALLHPMAWGLGRAFNGDVSFSRLFGDFNEWVDRKTLVVLQEAHRSRSRPASEVAETLKTLITAPPDTITVNEKFKGMKTIPNIVNLCINTNQETALFIGDSDRRYYVAASDEEPQGPEYFDRLWRWMDDERGCEAVVAWLMERKIKRVHPSKRPPMNAGKREMMLASFPPVVDLVEAATRGKPWVLMADVMDDIYVEANSRCGISIRALQTKMPAVMEYLGWSKIVSENGNDRIKVDQKYFRAYCKGPYDLETVKTRIRDRIDAEK